MDYYAIGQRIRNKRKQSMLSQEELAEKIGISTTHMSHIETANTKLSLQVLINIAEALHVSTDELLFEKSGTVKEDSVDRIIDILGGRNETEQKIMIDIFEATADALQKYL
jgi:transcriptional regulator with XRE-family HTH domain